MANSKRFQASEKEKLFVACDKNSIKKTPAKAKNHFVCHNDIDIVPEKMEVGEV